MRLPVIPRVGASVGVIVALSLFELRLQHVNPTTAALSMVVALLAIAARWGLVESIAASLAAGVCFNFFFLEPVRTLTIGHPQDLVAFGAFLVTAVVASHLSSSAKRRAMEANRRKHEMERLYQLSQVLMSMNRDQPLPLQIASRIAEVFQLDAVLFFDRESGKVHRGGANATSVSAAKLRESAEHDAIFFREDGFRVLPMPAGSLAVPDALVTRTTQQSLAQLAGVALKHRCAEEEASRAAAAHQSEELKSVMLDALAHDFKTPLTSLKAAASDLLSAPSQEAPDRELLEIVNEQADLMNSMVSDALEMARVEAGGFSPRKTSQPVKELVSNALRRGAGRIDQHPIDIRIDDALGPVEVDAKLLEIVIWQLVDNAAKFSPPDAPIVIRAGQENGSVFVAVADRGPGVSEADKAGMFERFYRGREARKRIPGTGMGLAIARDIIRAHGGDIHVNSRLGEGCEVVFSIPAIALVRA